MTKNVFRIVVYTQSVSGYIPNGFHVKSLIPNYILCYINWVWYKNQNYSSPDGDYLQRIFNIIQEKHLQSCEQYNISVFQKIWDFLFNDPVIVNWGKIHTSQQSNFEILNFETYNLPYDWASISHFRSKAYRTQKSVGHTIESNVS